MRIPRLAELTVPPVVGERYRVPCVWTPIRCSQSPRWLPVIGPDHEDVDIIGFAPRHWHRDYRFWTDYELEAARGCYGAGREFGVVTFFFTDMRISERIKVCRRETAIFPVDVPNCRGNRSPNAWLRRLEGAFEQQTLKACRVCPHRGIPLASLPADAEGVVVCPGHGLAWNVHTGRLVSRVSHSAIRNPQSAME